MPTKRNREYWAERFVLLQESQLNKSESYLMDLDREYKKATMQIERDIAVWYQRLADNNGVSLAAAKRMLTNSELAEFRWTVEEYIKRGKENAIDKRWMRELENASVRVHISRLDAIKLQLQQQAELIYGNHLDQTDNLLRDIYSGGFYHTAFEIQRGIGIGAQLAALDDRQIRSVLSKPWAPDGENFSSRIWKDKARLVNELHSGLMQQVMRGSSPQQAINTIAKRFNTSRTRAGRLVMTESAFFASAGQQDCYKELGIDRFEIVSTLDSDICDDCGDLDGKPFPMSDYVIGVTAPPFHPNCRCCTAPYFDDEFEEGSERAARDEETGKTYYVPADMTYKEWAKTQFGNKDIIIGRNLGAAAFRDKVILPSGSHGRLAEGSKITKVVTFAGKGTGKEIKVANHLEKQYNVPAAEWKKVRGDGYVEYPDGNTKHVELHWFESKETGRIKMKVKRVFDDEG